MAVCINFDFLSAEETMSPPEVEMFEGTNLTKDTAYKIIQACAELRKQKETGSLLYR